ncbi:hypothetical protein CALCODRAFT_362123 [Calocera cornea HHB12733]|uniref:Metallo-dependent hydrolase n=1 Tax=Calocera cornea HHB12733 TaxID=1353952 RepID=A0A165EJW1_9BASI|nr:hypothetical protein CALCODRAFT_362123 [Calocera cornea HHB12733]
MIIIIHNARVAGNQNLVKITCDSETCRITTVDQQARRSLVPPLWLRRRDIHNPTPVVQLRRQSDDLIVIDAGGSLVLPGLVHAHLHLSQAFFGEEHSGYPDGSELLFSPRGVAFIDPDADIEFLFGKATSDIEGSIPMHEQKRRAAALVRLSSLAQSGRQIIEASLSHGVTTVRAQVDVDAMVGYLPLHAAFGLQTEFEGRCDIRLSAFASQPIYCQRDRGFMPNHTHGMKRLLQWAVSKEGVRAVGSAPFTEGDQMAAIMNIHYILDLAETHGVDAEFKLDLDITEDERVMDLIEEVQKRPAFHSDFYSRDPAHANFPLRVTIAHHGRLADMHPTPKSGLAEAVAGWEIYFVGFPYVTEESLSRPVASALGTGNGSLVKDLDAHTSIAFENAGSPMTPWDTDPLALPTVAALFNPYDPEDPSEAKAQSLLRMVTINAAAAAGMGKRAHPQSLLLRSGDVANLVILDGCFDCRTAVCSPPYGRITIKRGRVVAGDLVTGWTGR